MIYDLIEIQNDVFLPNTTGFNIALQCKTPKKINTTICVTSIFSP